MSNCNTQKNMSIPLLSLVGVGRESLIQNKLEQAASGTKTFTEPKTAFGRFFGKLSGRSQAFELQQQVQKNPFTIDTNQLSQNRQPFTGSVSFGEQARQNRYLPYIIVAVIGLIIYNMNKKKPNRRRR